MSVLRSLESKLESLFEGVFGRAFRANVQPVEMARKLVKEMDDHRNVSVSRVYVPNEYTVYLAPADRDQFAGYEDSLRGELEEYLAEHARREHYVLLTPPRVKFEVDADLDVGVFGIATRLVRGSRTPIDAPPTEAAPGETMVYQAVEAPPAPVEPEPAPEPEARPLVVLSFDGKRHEADAGNNLVIGRSRDCDFQIPDPNVSRRHAELRRQNGGYMLVDLDSTNGVEADGRRVKELRLENGTSFTIGSTEIVFSQELG
jgi:FhaA, N-terminal domain/FHA domain